MTDQMMQMQAQMFQGQAQIQPQRTKSPASEAIGQQQQQPLRQDQPSN